MIVFLFSFIGSQLFYQIFVVLFWFWLKILSPEKIAILRDWIWIIMSLILFLFHIKYWKNYFSKWLEMIVAFLILIGFTSFFSRFSFGKGITEILIWIKYGFRYFFILLLSIGIWYFIQKRKKFELNSDSNILKWIKRGIVFTLITGRIWQILKLLVPEYFYHLWYWGLDDFHFWVNPPIYYLTGFKWHLRRQGLFSWPNNYAYFLVVFIPLLWKLFEMKNIFWKKKWEKSEWISLFILFLWIITLGSTLSRAGLIGGTIAIILINIKTILRHKKWLIWGICSLVIAVIGLSIWKWESTRIHIEKKLWGIMSVIDHPLGQGLWSSWPAIHHWGTVLPENYYLQLMIDMGTIGFLFWCTVMGIFFRKQKKLKENFYQSKSLTNQIEFLKAFQQGLLALMVMGLFLHVFEDSMVNYLFFSLYGLMIGYIQALIEKNDRND